MTPASESGATVSPAAGVRFAPPRTALLPVIVLALGTLPLASSAGALNALLLVPLGCAVWVLRARVRVSSTGVEVCNGLSARTVPWPRVEGFAVPRRGPVRLLPAGGRPLLLTALPRRSLPALRAAAEQAGRSAPDGTAPGGTAS